MPRRRESRLPRDLILATVSDTVGRFLYYDRKEDEELPVGKIEQTIEKGEITLDEIVAAFRAALIRDGRLEDTSSSE